MADGELIRITPDPERVNTPADLGRELNLLRIKAAAGTRSRQVSLRELSAGDDSARPGVAGAVRPGYRVLVPVLIEVLLALISIVGVWAMHVSGPTSDRVEARPPAAVDPTLRDALRNAAPCAESLMPPKTTSGRQTLWASEPGPSGAARPTRLIELHFGDHPVSGAVAWAILRLSTSERDRLWIDWSYLSDPTPGDTTQWRQCGPHPITARTDTPAILLQDDEGRIRWFRACGQVPPQERVTKAKSFCTGWHRPP